MEILVNTRYPILARKLGLATERAREPGYLVYKGSAKIMVVLTFITGSGIGTSGTMIFCETLFRDSS